MTGSPASGSERALILAPLGRDAQIAAAILEEADIGSAICADLACLREELEAGAGLALIVEEALQDQDYAPLAAWVDAQPAWSDLPIVVLARRGGGLERNPSVGRYTQALGNITFLERPFHPTTLVSVVQTALRGRRRQYEARERLEAIRSAEERFRTLADNIPILCWMAGPDGRAFWYNLRWYEYTGAIFGQAWEAALNPAARSAAVKAWARSIETGEPFEMTLPIRDSMGVTRPFLTRIVPLREADDRIVRWFGTSTDVSRQQKDQEHLRLMINELNHRVKNTLATVQSIVAQSLRRDDVPATLRETLTSRILALSHAHDVLTDEQWAGADLREIAAQAAVPYESDHGDARIRLDGPPVRLPPKTAIAVALALHELATNAAKYGALTTAAGRVDLHWTLREHARHRALSIVWRETGGPPVSLPKRTGFGTRLIERGLAADLQGQVVITYPREGVICTVEARLPLETDGDAPPAEEPDQDISPPSETLSFLQGEFERLQTRSADPLLRVAGKAAPL